MLIIVYNSYNLVNYNIKKLIFYKYTIGISTGDKFLNRKKLAKF